MSNTRDLIIRAQDGDFKSREDLFKLIRDHHMDAHVARYRSRNVLIDEDDIESQFLMGAFEALEEVDPDIGNPILFMCWKGRMAVARHFKSTIRRGVKVKCNNCGRSSFGYKNRTTVCGHCGSADIDTWMVRLKEGDIPLEDDQNSTDAFESLAQTAQPLQQESNAFIQATFRIQIEEIRDRLNGRVLQLFDKIVLEQINPQTSQNYLKEIAEEWGMTTACVSVYLRKLRTTVTEYMQESP